MSLVSGHKTTPLKPKKKYDTNMFYLFVSRQ